MGKGEREDGEAQKCEGGRSKIGRGEDERRKLGHFYYASNKVGIINSFSRRRVSSGNENLDIDYGNLNLGKTKLKHTARQPYSEPYLKNLCALSLEKLFKRKKKYEGNVESRERQLLRNLSFVHELNTRIN